MKFYKILCLICLLFATLTLNAQAAENLYIVKNIPKENLSNLVSDYYSLKNYNITQNDGFYILPNNNDSQNFYEILLEQNGLDCYLYYFSNGTQIKDNLALIKELQKGHLKIKAIEANSDFRNRAALLKSNYEKALKQSSAYNFDDEAQEEFDKKNNIPQTQNNYPKPYSATNANNPDTMSIPVQNKLRKQKLANSANYKPIPNQNDSQFRSIEQRDDSDFDTIEQPSSKVLKGSVVTIASGSIINASLQSAISSASMSQSDRITAVLSNDFRYNGQVILPKETIIYGTALKANASTYAYGNGSLDLTFNQALLPNGKKINLSVDKISYAKKSERAENITKDVALGTGIGLLGGLLSGALTGNYSQALIVGASLGAAGGGIKAGTHKGEEIEIPEGTELNLKTNQPINISPYN